VLVFVWFQRGWGEEVGRDRFVSEGGEGMGGYRWMSLGLGVTVVCIYLTRLELLCTRLFLLIPISFWSVPYSLVGRVRSVSF